ncbi:MAG: 50S ribosomal protein L22 [Candidatus Syntropharchaeia archaeon]
MGRINYSVEMDPDTTAKAMGYELPISPKHAVEICTEIRGKRVEEAKKYLQDVIDLKKPVPFRRHKKKVGHRRGLRKWYAGRYPKKACSAILKVIENAEANAEYKDLDKDKLRIVHISVKKGRTIRSIFPRAFGRATPKRRETATVEVILGETWQ